MLLPEDKVAPELLQVTDHGSVALMVLQKLGFSILIGTRKSLQNWTVSTTIPAGVDTVIVAGEILKFAPKMLDAPDPFSPTIGPPIGLPPFVTYI